MLGAQCTDDSILTVATADALLGDGDYRRAYQDYFHRFPNAGYGGNSKAPVGTRRQHLPEPRSGGPLTHLLPALQRPGVVPDARPRNALTIVTRFPAPSATPSAARVNLHGITQPAGPKGSLPPADLRRAPLHVAMVNAPVIPSTPAPTSA
jgi:hypothetical protein